MADRALFSVDQTAFTDKIILWDFRKRSENPDLDCGFSLSTSVNY